MSARRALTSVLLLALTSCTNFPEIEANTCGNAVIEQPVEDCDTYVDEAGVKGAVCRPHGVVGECHWDCSLNTDGTRAACPTGWGCDVDSICRMPNDQFAKPIKLSSDLSSWLTAADFDGDGRSDLISTEPADQFQQARFRLHYFDTDADLVETRVFPRITTRPAVYRSPDDQTNLIFSNFRIGMLPGRTDREWVPAAFTSYQVDGAVGEAWLRAVSLQDTLVGGATALVAITSIGGKTGLFVPSAATEGIELLPRVELMRPLSGLVGVPLTVDLLVGKDSPCKELVLAYRGDASLSVFDMCRLGGSAAEPDLLWREQSLELHVALPRGAKIDTAPLAADVNGDGHQDLLLGSAGQVFVAYGDGSSLADAVGPLVLPMIAAAPFELPVPLAAGDISGDGVADFVLPTVVISSRRSPLDGSIAFASSYANHAEPWTMAEIADLNVNGFADVVAAAEGAPGITFLNGTGSQFPVPARLSTRGPMRMLNTGDFDGDLINDVAFLEAAARKGAAEPLAIAFGAANGLPLAETRIAEMTGAEQLGHTRDHGIDSLFVASNERIAGGSRGSLTLFDGNPDRLPFAPYTLVAFAQMKRLDDSIALAVVVGGFTEPGASDVIALGAQDLADGFSLWLAPHITGEKVPPRLLDFERVPGVLPVTPADGEQAFRLSVAAVAVDLDSDGLDEVVALMPAGPSDCALLSYDIDAERDRANLTGQMLLGEPCPAPELGSADFDPVDGRADTLLILIGDPLLGQRRLTVLSKLGDGFSLDQRRFIEAPAGHEIRGFSVVPPGQLGEFGTRLAFVSDDALYVTTRRGEGNFGAPRRIRAFTDARSVVATDPNGDGISDIAVADADGLWLLEAGFLK